MMKNKLWLSGYYPPDIDVRGGFARWSEAWSTGPSADDDWVWVNCGYYTEDEAREVLRKKELLKSDGNENEDEAGGEITKSYRSITKID